jgi:hypothetical protein
MASRQEPVLKQRIFEARYTQGYRYLDRCGDAILVLEKLLAEETGRVWLVNEATPAGARIHCPDLEITVVFDSRRLVVDRHMITKFDCDFVHLATTILAVLTGRFGLGDIQRFGSRRMKIIPVDSIEDAEKLALKVSKVTPWWPVGEGTFAPRAFEHTYVFDRPDRSKGVNVMTRVFAKVGADVEVDERLKQPPHYLHADQRTALLEQLRRASQQRADPETGLLIDVDYYWVWPPKNPSANEFLEEAWRESDRFENELLKASRA